MKPRIEITEDKIYILKGSISADIMIESTLEQAKALKDQLLDNEKIVNKIEAYYKEELDSSHASVDCDNYGCMTCARIGIINEILGEEMK